jgi:hypothetical protein
LHRTSKEARNPPLRANTDKQQTALALDMDHGGEQLTTQYQYITPYDHNDD